MPAETGALIALLERGEVEAINMFEPHTTRLTLSGRYRVLLDFDIELENIFGAPPLKSSIGMLKDTVGKATWIGQSRSQRLYRRHQND